MIARRGPPPGGQDPERDDGTADLDDEEDGPAQADVGATIACPYCGAPNEIALDPSGGPRQDYVEDCQVCCQPWNVRIRYRRDGTADVHVDVADAN